MSPASSMRKPRWITIPVRVLFVTLLLTLLSFAVALLLSIVAMVIAGKLRGTNPDMRFAYRSIALPAAVVTGTIVLVLTLAMEIRHYRQSKTLAGIVRVSR